MNHAMSVYNRARCESKLSHRTDCPVWDHLAVLSDPEKVIGRRGGPSDDGAGIGGFASVGLFLSLSSLCFLFDAPSSSISSSGTGGCESCVGWGGGTTTVALDG